MIDKLDSSEIKKRSIFGVKWIMILSIAGMGLESLTAILLGRIGPKALGSYALSKIIIALMASLIVLGGRSLLQNFMPKMQGPDLRCKLLISYWVIGAASMAVFVILFGIFPSLFSFFIRHEITPKLYVSFIALCVVVVSGEYLLGALAGMMQLTASSVARAFRYVVPFGIVLTLFFTAPKFLRENTLIVMLVAFFVAYLFIIIICTICLIRDKRFSISFGWHFPGRATRYYWTVSFLCLSSFIYTQFDRIIVFGRDNLSGLGMYQAVITLVLLLEYLPKILQDALIPIYSSIVSNSEANDDKLNKVFQFLARYIVLLMCSVALFLILFSYEMLNIFGQEYKRYYFLLCGFCLAGAIRSLAYVLTPVYTSKEFNRFRIFQSSSQITIQIILTFLFLQLYGVIAVAGAKIFGVVYASTVSICYAMYCKKFITSLPLIYKAGVVIVSVAVIIRVMLGETSVLINVLLFSASIGILLCFSDITFREILNNTKAILKRQELSSKILMDSRNV